MERPLFGGAITCRLPTDWIDVSDIRQVPDHQEVWKSPADALWVMEILEYQDPVANTNAAAFFFEDLASDNDTTITDRQFTPIHDATSTLPQMTAASNTLPMNNASLCFGKGFQRVKLGRDVDMAGNPRVQEIRWICVELCVVRLPSVGTDLLVTLSTPSETNPQDEEEGNNNAVFSEAFQQAISSLEIRDWSLFG